MCKFYNRQSFRGVTVGRSVICESSTADPQILWPKLHAHAHLRCLALAHILRTGMCYRMPGVQSQHCVGTENQGRADSNHRNLNIMYSVGCTYVSCISSKLLSCVIVYDPINNSGLK